MTRRIQFRARWVADYLGSNNEEYNPELNRFVTCVRDSYDEAAAVAMEQAEGGPEPGWWEVIEEWVNPSFYGPGLDRIAEVRRWRSGRPVHALHEDRLEIEVTRWEMLKCSNQPSP